MALGQTNREIAGRLVISPLTAKTHVQNILQKLGVQSRVQVAVIAARHGLIGSADANDDEQAHRGSIGPQSTHSGAGPGTMYLHG